MSAQVTRGTLVDAIDLRAVQCEAPLRATFVWFCLYIRADAERCAYSLPTVGGALLACKERGVRVVGTGSGCCGATMASKTTAKGGAGAGAGADRVGSGVEGQQYKSLLFSTGYDA